MNSRPIFGRNPVLEWLHAGLPVEKMLVSKDSGAAMLEIQKYFKGPITQVQRQDLTRQLNNDTHQGIAIWVKLPEFTELHELLRQATKSSQNPVLAILDQIQDPHNFGAILRSADAAGINGVLIAKDNAVGMTPAVFKASAGAAAYVPVAQVTNIVRTMQELKEQGFWFIGAEQNGDKPYTEAKLSGPIGIVLGSEGKGIRRLVKENCDFLVHIPMQGRINSLNVSVAAALLFFEVQRQRKP
jgi:23S rRNA (guanosine2251-2'-O)-methyltransferase